MKNVLTLFNVLPLATSLAIVTPGIAQEVTRTPLPHPSLITRPAPAPTPSPSAAPTVVPQGDLQFIKTGPEGQDVPEGPELPPIDDEPNFAPTETWDATESDVNRKIVLKGNPYVLAFENGTYTPNPGLEPALVGEIARAGKAYGFIMINGRMSPAKMRSLEKLGIKLLGWHTWQSVKAEIPITALNGLQSFPFVHWVGSSRPEQRLSAELASALKTSVDSQVFDITVNFFDSDIGPASRRVTIGEQQVRDNGDVFYGTGASQVIIPNGPGQQALEALGFKFDFYDDMIFGMRGTATKAQILEMRKLNCVVAIELTQRMFGFHDQTMAMVSQDRVRNIYPGTDVPVGVIDSGLDSTPWHTDLTGKSYWGWSVVPNLSAWADGQGHGTHVTGTVCGRGAANSRYKGAAPSVGAGGNGDFIYIGRYLDNSNKGQGNVASLYSSFSQNVVYQSVTNPKPTLVNNSWGGLSSSGYNGTGSSARSVDGYVHTYQQCYVFAAGNTSNVSGTWCATPGDAKNVLTVGSLHDKFAATTYPGTPSSFTRRQTTDGRRKPEVSAPGEILTSCNINTSTGYTNKSGTSMATPTTVGVLASLVNRASSWYIYRPALLKAVMACTAKYGTGSTGFDTIQGFGCINSYKANYANRTNFTTFRGTITSPSSGTGDVFVDVPADAIVTKVVLAHTEAAASSLATKAVTDNLKLWADAPPYTTGFTGDWSMSNTTQNVLWGGGSSTWKGQRVRFRVQATALRSGQRVDYGVVIFWYRKSGGAASSATMTSSVDKTIVKPGESVVLTGTLNAGANNDEFNHAQIYYSSPTSWTTTRIDRTGGDNLVQSYTGTTHTSYPYPSLAAGTAGGMTVGQGTSRGIKFTLRAPATSASYTLYTRSRRDGASASTLAPGRVVCVDGLAPPTISGLKANRSTSTWYNSTSITFNWTGATDSGCAGVSLLRYERSNSGLVHPTTSSSSLSAVTTGYGTSWSGSGNSKYFALRVYDNAGNQSGSAYVGPYWVDLTNPAITSLQTNTPTVTSLSANVSVVGTDTYSGVKYIQYSNNNSTWSGSVAYTTAYRAVSLSAYGGNSNEGTKAVYVRLLDGAGNVSAVQRVLVTYIAPPVINSNATGALPAVNSDYFRLIGTGFTETTRVELNGTINTKWTSANQDWWPTGAFQVVSDTEIRVFPPQGLNPGTYGVRTHNGFSFSNSFNVQVVANKTNVLRTSMRLTTGSKQTIMVTKGSLKSTVSGQFIMASVFKSPSVLPGYFNFAIGAGFSQIVFFPTLPFDGNGVSRVVFPTSVSFKGITAYFQSGYQDFTPNVVWPMPVSDVWSTYYQ